MKALCAVVFVLSSLGATAQALDASTAYCVDDFFGGIIEQSTIPAQIIPTEPAIEKLGEAVDEAHGVTTTGPKDAANVPVGAIQPSDETRRVEYATGKGNKLTVHGTIEQNTIPAQIVATEPAIEKLGEPDDIAITGANDVKVVPVKTIQASSATESSTRSDDKLMRDDRLDQGTMAPHTGSRTA